MKSNVHYERCLLSYRVLNNAYRHTHKDEVMSRFTVAGAKYYSVPQTGLWNESIGLDLWKEVALEIQRGNNFVKQNTLESICLSAYLYLTDSLWV